MTARRRPLDADIPERRTADGVVVKRGDTIWWIRGYGMPSRSKVTRDRLKVWSSWGLDREAYADEHAVLIAARNGAARRLHKAKLSVRSEERTIARISERLP